MTRSPSETLRRSHTWSAGRRAGLFLLLTLACGGDGRSNEPAPEAPVTALSAETRPNILLVALCTFRYSHMGAAGYERPTTPFLDSLAAEGLFFENAVSAASWTKPATASILTGLTPGVHGMTDFYEPEEVARGLIAPKRVLADGVTTLAEALRNAGYATAARINNVHVSEHFNMTQGFEDSLADKRLDAERMVDALEAWLPDLPPDRPFFFFLMSRDPHVTFDPRYEGYLAFNRAQPLVPRDEYRKYTFRLRRQVLEALEEDGSVPPELARRYVDLYDAELAQQDAALARLPGILERAGRREQTVIIVTADHGEHFFEHGLVGHGARLDEATLHIPLILSGPGIPVGLRSAALARSIDIFPTLTTLASAPAPDILQGRDLLADLPSGSAAPAGNRSQAVDAFASVYADEHMLRRGPHSYYLRRSGERELFDLDRDRGERHDLGAREPELRDELHAALLGWLESEEALRQRVEPGESRALPAEAVRELRELGYIE